MKPEITKNLTTKIAAIGLIGAMANMGLVACSRTPGSSNADTDSQINIVDISNDEIDNAAIAGGWKIPDDQAINASRKAIFDKAMEKLDEAEFIAEMADDFSCWKREKEEVADQRRDVRKQALALGLIGEHEDEHRHWKGW